MRIVMVVGKSTGGIGAYVDALSHEITKQGHQVRILTDALTAKHFDWEDADLFWPVFPRSFNALKNLNTRLRNAVKLLASADVVHAHGHRAGLLCLWLLRRWRATPILVVSHHNWLTSSIPKVLAGIVRKATAKRAALVTGSSSDLVASARKDGAKRVILDPIPSAKVPRFLKEEPLNRPARAELWADLAKRERLENRGQLVLAVGKIEPRKRYDVLIKAVDSIGYPATVAVIGEGDARLLASLRSQGSELKVHFLGTRKNLAEWLKAASVLVMPSDWEARSFVVQEALAAGLPVVATRTGGLKDLLGGDEVTRELLVSSGKPEEYGVAIGKLLSDPSYWYECQKHGRDIASTWDNRETVASKWIKRYRDLLGGLA